MFDGALRDWPGSSRHQQWTLTRDGLIPPGADIFLLQIRSSNDQGGDARVRSVGDRVSRCGPSCFGCVASDKNAWSDFVHIDAISVQSDEVGNTAGPVSAVSMEGSFLHHRLKWGCAMIVSALLRPPCK
jgi:hypothetical protein